MQPAASDWYETCSTQGMDAGTKFYGLGATFLFAIAGCSDAGNAVGATGSSGVRGDSRTSGTDSGTERGGSDDGGILTAGSEALEIRWFNYWEGGYRFERRLDQLLPDQLALAEAIKIVPSTGECWEDAVEMSITVTGAGTRRFGANEFAGTCGHGGTLVNFGAVSALLDTVHCLPAKSYDAGSADTAPSIVADDGCWHGLFNGSSDTPEWWFRTEIPAAGEYQIALDACGNRALQIDVFEDDTTTKVASTSGEGECPVLTHAFTDAGSYALRVKMLSGTTAGDFYMAVESTVE